MSRPSSNISENNDAHLGVNLVLGYRQNCWLVGHLILPVIAIKWTLKRAGKIITVSVHDCKCTRGRWNNILKTWKTFYVSKKRGVSFHVNVLMVALLTNKGLSSHCSRVNCPNCKLAKNGHLVSAALIQRKEMTVSLPPKQYGLYHTIFNKTTYMYS